MNYKLSPSDLTFSYEGCKRCFYQKVVNNIAQPSITLPSIFSKIAGLLKDHYDGNMPRETWEDGVFVAELVMASYMATESGKTLRFPPEGLEEFVPKVARGTWNPRV